eukprot:12559731-Alexandrium_andersonii.AAC.1
MSASLVGSEMCIRDRNCSAKNAKSSARKSAAPARLADSLPPLLAARWVSVSYTHLTLPTICSV